MATSEPPSMAESSDPQSGIIATRPKGKWATPEEWMAVKPIIRRMYLEDNVPLKDVMATLETQHGFHGTIKMYKNKLNEWGFFKTFKPRDVLDALRALEARKASGEDHPTVNMRGTEVGIPWIRDYIKRNRKRINKIVRSQAAAISSSADSSPPPTTLATTGSIRLTEELLATMNLYVDNAMSCGLWYIDQIGFYRSQKGNTGTYFLYDFWDRLDEASQAMSKSQQIDLIDLLNPAFSRLNDIVREEDPRSFPFLLGCFEVLRLRGRSDLIETFLKYIWQLSSTLLGPTYPHSQIWRQAYLMFRTGTQEELIEQVFLLLMDRYHSQGTRQMVAAQVLGGGGNPYLRKCTSGLHVAYKTCLENLELTIKQQLERLEHDENSRFMRSRSASPGAATTSQPSAEGAIAGPSLPNANELRNQLAQLRADHTAGILGILRSAGQFQEAQEALDVLAPISEPDPNDGDDYDLFTPPSAFEPQPQAQPQSRSLSPSSPSSSSSSSQSSQNSQFTKKKKAKRSKTPDKLAQLVSLVESKKSSSSTTGDPPSLAVEHLSRLVEHLADNPSVYRDEGWINWIFEGLASVPRLAGTASSEMRGHLKEHRAVRLAREKHMVSVSSGAAASPSASTSAGAGFGGASGNEIDETSLIRSAVDIYLQRNAQKEREQLALSMIAEAVWNQNITIPGAPGGSGSELDSPARILKTIQQCATQGDQGGQSGCPQGLELAPGHPMFTNQPRADLQVLESIEGVTSTMGTGTGTGTGTGAGADRPWLEATPLHDPAAPGLESLVQGVRRETRVPLDKVYRMENTCRGGWKAVGINPSNAP